MVKCNICGEEMAFFDKVVEVDWNFQEMTIVEEWECLECDVKHRVEVIGKLQEIKISC